jgi:glycosyltransferase involved in cell wall biosynthesis
MTNCVGAQAPLISIIVPTLRQRPDSLKRTLDSISKYTPIPYEIILAEGGDCYSASMNIALKKAKGKFVTIPGIADDIEVQEGWVDDLKTGVFQVFNPDGTLESYGGFVNPEVFNTDSETEPDYGGYGIVSREVFEAVGLMDENFKPIYCEDADYGLRIHEAGFNLPVLSGKITHYHEESGRVLGCGNNKEYLWKKHKLQR